MAQAGAILDPDRFCCSVCLNLLRDPVTIPCGHSYCMGCIKDYWNLDDYKGYYSCPQCRLTFASRPVLYINNMLAEVVEKLKAGLLAAPPDHCYAGPGDVACDVCTGRKLKAVKSCLVCLASYCETHLQPHVDSPPLRKHKLIDATGQLQEKICSLHDKILEIYCHTDKQCICYLCTMDKHRGHNTVSVAAERAEKQSQLGKTQREIQQRIQEREKELEELRIAVESLTRSAQEAVEDSERIFTELICSIKRMRSEVKQLIRAQEKAAVSRAEGLLEELNQEIADLRMRDAGLEQLSQMEDHIHFLQSFESLCAPPGSGDLPSITVSPHCFFEDVRKAFSVLKEHLQDVCETELENISVTASKVHIIKPMTREDFFQYACQLSLDPNTVNENLSLSEGDRVVTFSVKPQTYPDHPERFDCRSQVVCREGLSGRCYWEAEWNGSGAAIAVTYKGINRKGKNRGSRFGLNVKSWGLNCTRSSYSFCNSKNKTAVPAPSSSRIGVYLDHGAGVLSFYSVSDTMTLLHRVRTTFTQPLYAGFSVCTGSSVKLCDLQSAES